MVGVRPRRPAAAATAETGDGSPRTLHDVLLACGPRFAELDPACVKCQGVSAPLHAPVLEVWRALRHADLYLYVIVVTSKPAGDVLEGMEEEGVPIK